MALVDLGGEGINIPFLPDWFWGNGTSMSSSPMTIDATGEKIAFTGRVLFPARTGTKDIRNLLWRWGTIVKAGGSALTASLQDVNTAGSTFGHPDGTQDQTVAIANAEATFASDTWFRTGNLSANRTVNYGELLAVVIEFDGSGRLGSDSVIISTLGRAQNSNHAAGSWLSNAGGTYSASNNLHNIILEFSDGTFGTLKGSFPFKTITSHNYHLNSGTEDEFALDFTPSVDMKVDGFDVSIILTSTSDFEGILYEGTTALKTRTCDSNANTAAGVTARLLQITFDEPVTLNAGTSYKFAIRPTTTNPLTIFSFDVDHVDHWDCHSCLDAALLNTRLNQGGWIGTVSTRRPFIFPRIVSLDDGAGGGSSGAGLARVRLGM